MTLIRVTLSLAFHDMDQADAATVADLLTDFAVDRLNAEVVERHNCTSQSFPIPDPDPDSDDVSTDPDAYEAWQKLAHEKIAEVSHA